MSSPFRLALFALAFGAVGVSACAETDIYGVPLVNEAAINEMAKDLNFAPSECGMDIPVLTPEFLNALPACCGGAGRCIPPSPLVDEASKKNLKTCDDGGTCVPTGILRTGSEPLKTCKSREEKPGVCVSTCIKSVERFKLILPQDTCEAEERCVPCENNGNSTGLCDLGKKKDNAPPKPASCTAEKKPGPDICPHKGKPAIDPSKLKSCGDGAHCLPTGLIQAAFRDQLDKCPGTDGLCAPDTLIAAAGNFVPKTCASLSNAEGRCLSTALPTVRAQQDVLPQEGCEKNERCAPCYDPVSGKALPSCTISCDPGPTKPKVLFKGCGENRGRCVPKSVVGGGTSELVLEQGECEDGELCAPLAAVKQDETPKTCKYPRGTPGVCYQAVFSLLSELVVLSKRECDDGFLCAPCDAKKPAKGCPPATEAPKK